MSVKKYGEYGSFEHLLFLSVLFWCFLLLLNMASLMTFALSVKLFYPSIIVTEYSWSLNNNVCMQGIWAFFVVHCYSRKRMVKFLFNRYLCRQMFCVCSTKLVMGINDFFVISVFCSM